MKNVIWTAAAIAAAAVSVAMPAFAEGDPAAGEKVFRQCQTCHVVVNDAGETLAGRNGKVGPNLYAIAGRTAGSLEGFSYSSYMVKAGEAGLAWNEEDFVAYVQDPSGFLGAYLDDGKARGKMAFKLREAQDASDVWAYISSLAPES